MPSLTTMPGRYAICRLPAGSVPQLFAASVPLLFAASVPQLLAAPVPPPIAGSASFVSVTRTCDEVSIVCDERNAPEGARVDPGWNLLKVDGPLEFSAVGIVASLASPIAAAKISLFVISTFDTDYILVKTENLDAAAAALRQAGHSVHPGGTTA